MTAAIFYSIRSKKDLQKEIDRYMEDFEYFSDELFIQDYKVVDVSLYRKIVITY